MDAATTNSLFVLLGVAVGTVPGTVVPFLERRTARSERQEEQSLARRQERVEAFGAFLTAAGRVLILVVSNIPPHPGGRMTAVLIDQAERELEPDELTALIEAQQAASRALLLAKFETRDKIDALMGALYQGLLRPQERGDDIEPARKLVVEAFCDELETG